METGQSKVLAKLQNRSKGSYDDVKTQEAKAGGRSLPAGLKGGIAAATQLKLDENSRGDPYVYLYASVVTPEDLNGIHSGVMWTLADSDYGTYQDELSKFINDMKLLGFEELVLDAADETELIVKCIEAIASEEVFFEFNTSNRARKDGSYRPFVQGRVDPPKDAPKKKPAKDGYKESSQPSSNGAIAVGATVQTIGDYFNDGETWEGEVVSDKDGETEVLFSDGETVLVPSDSLELTSSQEEIQEESSEGWEEGDRVRTTGDFFGDGEAYEGTVQVIGEDEADVLFDDGETITVPSDSLEAPE
tara:strand:+ start:1702 stop:2613 length:912 start_codon:yes stop_codon:yes gene_type:complete